MPGELQEPVLEQLFTAARSHNAWFDGEIPDAQLRRLVDLLKMGPTSANCSPARFVFIKSPEAKARLKPFLSRANAEKTMRAPVTAIIATDHRFYDYLPKLFPHVDARPWFTGSKEIAEQTAFRNGTLQGGYLILAARALGLDCGPMSGFDNAGVDAEFFAGTEIRSNFICSLGKGDPAGLSARPPRFEFEEIAKII